MFQQKELEAEKEILKWKRAETETRKKKTKAINHGMLEKCRTLFDCSEGVEALALEINDLAAQTVCPRYYVKSQHFQISWQYHHVMAQTSTPDLVDVLNTLLGWFRRKRMRKKKEFACIDPNSGETILSSILVVLLVFGFGVSDFVLVLVLLGLA